MCYLTSPWDVKLVITERKTKMDCEQTHAKNCTLTYAYDDASLVLYQFPEIINPFQFSTSSIFKTLTQRHVQVLLVLLVLLLVLLFLYYHHSFQSMSTILKCITATQPSRDGRGIT